MSEDEQNFHEQEIQPLDDLYGIEDIALKTQKINKRIEFLKEYKRRKKLAIDKEIEVLENRIEFFKKIIIETFKKEEEKSVDFPGSCSIISRNQKSNWKITDSDEFIKIIRDAEDKGEKINKAIKEITEYIVKKKEANKLLDIWEQNGNLEKYFDIEKDNKASKTCIEKEPAKTNISFSYPEEDEENEIIEEDIPTENITYDAI